MFEWYFIPDAADIERCKGGVFPCGSGDAYKKKSTAIWHGKKWMKECGRSGEIKAVPAEKTPVNYILDY